MDTLREKLAAKAPLVGVACGSGLSAGAAAEGGADFLLALSAGQFRTLGLPSSAALLPFTNANRTSWELGTGQILPRAPRTPVFLGVCAQDADVDWPAWFEKAKAYGFAGVSNFPTVGFLDGAFRDELERSGLGFSREVDLLRRARAAGLLTLGFCLAPSEARAMRDVDILCLDLGFAEWTPPGTRQHDEAMNRALARVRAMLAAAGDVCAVVFGGPLALPQDAERVFEIGEVRGYVGGSAIERYPAELVIAQTVREFKRAASREGESGRLGAIVGRSRPMRSLFEAIRRVARSDASVLIVGESGTGKELVAREIHRLGPRQGAPALEWNCGATSESLALSEIFGHEKGAFTGATRPHRGKFELASGGTLFMDEVADLPPSAQAALLRVLEEKAVVRVGGEEEIPVDVRVIAASNQELLDAGRFRRDLYFRLSAAVLRVPPLRERREDIPDLLREFSGEFTRHYGRPAPPFSAGAREALLSHGWPGNVRELRNVVERVFIFGDGREISRGWIEEQLGGRGRPRESVKEVLARHGGNKTKAARELGVTRKTLYAWLKR